MVNALIFDCDGVLADTERDGHRVAFNQAFAELGLPIAWSEDGYREKLRIAGGKERMASELTPGFVRAHDLPEDPDRCAVEVWALLQPIDKSVCRQSKHCAFHLCRVVPEYLGF